MSKILEIWSGLFISDPGSRFLPIQDPGVKKVPVFFITDTCIRILDFRISGSGSATQEKFRFRIRDKHSWSTTRT
jgi:hypothetical protein